MLSSVNFVLAFLTLRGYVLLVFSILGDGFCDSWAANQEISNDRATRWLDLQLRDRRCFLFPIRELALEFSTFTRLKQEAVCLSDFQSERQRSGGQSSVRLLSEASWDCSCSVVEARRPTPHLCRASASEQFPHLRESTACPALHATRHGRS